MIVLTAAQAAKVAGLSPGGARAALAPAPFRDGTYGLPEDVVGDPAHADVASTLKGLPTVSGAALVAITYAPKADASLTACRTAGDAADLAAMTAAKLSAEAPRIVEKA